MLVLISQRNEKNKFNKPIDVLENNYINYFEKFGMTLIPVPNGSNVEEYFKLPVERIIISGGNDINPEMYNGKKGICQNVSDLRDATEKKLLNYAIKKKIPVLGICRGLQYINVHFKGKLNQKIENHVNKSHEIDLTEKKITEYSGYKKFKVNSFHNRGVTKDYLADELRAFATCDNLIEGLYHPKLPIAAIGWHPERESPDESINEKITQAFKERKLYW